MREEAGVSGAVGSAIGKPLAMGDGTVHSNRYTLITPAYNEGRFIVKSIEAVLAQTVLPSRWVIVDDGSTDDTWEIISRYARQVDFIDACQRIRQAGETYYGSNVSAILQGYARLRHLSFDYLGILDADMILGPHYYEEIFLRFDANIELGVAAGSYIEEIEGRWTESSIDRRSTPKALQVFRRTCYEQIGGYVPCPNGGEDTYTEIVARQHGWQTWSFPEILAVHQKPMGTGDGSSLLRSKFRLGLTDYCMSTHPVFMVVKCLRRSLMERPYFWAGLARLAGFAYGYVLRKPRQVVAEARRHVRREQMIRLRSSIGLGPRLWQPAGFGDKGDSSAGRG